MSTVDTLLRWSPLQLLSRSQTKSRPAVLAFHGVDDPDAFAGLMDRVRHSYHPISIEELDRGVNGDHRLSERSVLVTFDDGHRSVLEHGLPILSERGIPAVAFVVAGLLSTDTDFWWSAVTNMAAEAGGIGDGRTGSPQDLVRHLKRVPNEERLQTIIDLERSVGHPAPPRQQLTKGELSTLQSGGIDVGNHTWTHPCLNRCDPATIRSEIALAHTALEGALGVAPRWFAYPNGDWDQVAESTLADLGYRLAFLFDHRIVDRGGHPLRTSRLRVNSDTSPERFEIILSGLHPMIHRARGRR